MEKKKAKVLLIAGLVCLAISIVLFITGRSTNQQNLEIAQNATDAYEAARQIARNNQGETSIHMLRMFLLGIGGVFTVFGGITLLKRK